MTGGGRWIRRLKTTVDGDAGTPGVPWLDWEDEEVSSALLESAEGRRVAGGHGGCERRRRRLSVIGGKQRSEGEGGPESEGEVRGGRGCVASREGPGKEEAARQGGGGLLGRARASTQLLPLARGRRQGGSSGGGLGRLGRFWWAARVRPGKSFSLSLLFFSSVLFYLISFCHCFEF